MDSGFIFMAGFKTGVSLFMARWPNKRNHLLILHKNVGGGIVLDSCTLLHASQE
jgi:hypothetical protein